MLGLPGFQRESINMSVLIPPLLFFRGTDLIKMVK